MLPLRMLGFLWLMLSPCDAESTCPPDLNPLSLEPAEVVGGHGESFTVNCLSTDKKHKGMRWRVADEDFEEEEDFPFVPLNLTLTDWNMTAQCKIRLNDTVECSKDLNITVYKNPKVTTAVEQVTAGEETLYDLRCDIIDAAPLHSLVVTWYYNDGISLISQCPATAISCNNASNDLAPKNETVYFSVIVRKGEDAAQVRCEAQLDFGPRGPRMPVVSQTESLVALYAPGFREDNDTVSVLEGGDVTLNCDAEGNPPPAFDWTCDNMSMPRRNNSLSLAAVSADAVCICTAANYLGNATKSFSIFVMTPLTPAVPELRGCRLTVTPPEIVVRFGDPARANCSTSATDSAGIGWESAVEGTGFEQVQSILWSVPKLEEWDLDTFCYITENNGDQCQVSLPITVYKSPDTMVISGLESPLVESRHYRLLCIMTNVAPAGLLEVSWYRDNTTVAIERMNGTSVWPANVTSTLDIVAERAYNGSRFRCEVSLQKRSIDDKVHSIHLLSSAPHMAVVYYGPIMKSCQSHFSGLENLLRLYKVPCESDGNPSPKILWFHNDKPISSYQSLSRNDSGRYTGRFINLISWIDFSVNITVEYGPSFTCEKLYEVEANENVQRICEVDGSPAPTLTWLKDGKEMTRWTKHDSGQYILIAKNKHGSAKHTLKLDVLYAPELKEADQHMEVVQGGNVTLVCSAEGNPPPEVQWVLQSAESPQENAEWRQSVVVVAAATSTNAGVYQCSATNRLGKATRTVTVVIKDKATGIPPAVFWGLLIVLALLAILVLVIVLHKRQKKQGQYSFIPPGKDIPLAHTGARA